MKLIVLAAIIAAVSSTPFTKVKQWPWQVGKVYNYDVDSYTWTKFEQSVSNGNAFKAQFIIRVKAPGQLLAKLENPLYAQIQGEFNKDLPSDLTYKPVENIDTPFEIVVDGGRIVSLNVPNLALPYENLLKGLISALQVDLTTYRNVHDDYNYFDKQTYQGLFKKMEADVTGDCETLYSVSPMSAEWRRELPKFTLEESPIEIIKSKDYGSCKKRISYHFGVPEGAVWKGIPEDDSEKQFIKHTSEARIIAGKQGTIYKSEVLSSVLVNPLIFGKQKAEVYSIVKFYLNAVELDNIAEWTLSKDVHLFNSLLYSFNEPTDIFTPANDQNIVNAGKLLQEITPLLLNSNDMPKGEFLSKFNILVDMIASMSPDQLNQMTNSIVITKTSKNTAKNNMWIIYRNAVAQAGTINAFNHIKSWIQTKKIAEMEAADVIAFIPGALRYPTNEFMAEFFDFALSAEVKEQKFLNNSALLAATKLVRLGDDNALIIETVIPRLSKELKQAIENGDDTKAQVYIRVLGNLAHPEILDVFASYLEDHNALTKYLRIEMVTSLKTLANLKYEGVRVALFSILKNTAEPYEVRVAAAINIFMSFPTNKMFEVMAHMTNEDPSTQVRAVLANSIAIASKLKSKRFEKLATSAQSVMHIVTKHKYGYRYSTDSIIDGHIADDEVSFLREMSYIGSEDSPLPKYHRSALRTGGIGMTEEGQFTLSVSDMQQLMDYINNYSGFHINIENNFKYTAKKIAEILKIKREQREPFQGALFVENWNQQSLITFTESEINDLIKDVVSNLKQLVMGVEKSYTTVVSQKQTSVIFPLAMGMPFVFEYNEPTVLTADVKSNIKLGSRVLNNDIQFTFARNLDGRVGFFDTIGKVYAISGVINKFQLNTPFLLKTQLKSEEIQASIIFDAEKDINFVHFSVWPYTTLQKKDSPKTIFEEPATKFIERQSKVISTDMKFGQQTGFALALQGYSYSTDYRNLISLVDTDILTSTLTLLYQKDVALTEFNLTYKAKESKNKVISMSGFFKRLDNQHVEGEMGPPTHTAYVMPGSNARREKIVKQAAAGLSTSKVYLSDVSIVFEGKENVAYILTTAYGASYVNHNGQLVAFIKNGNEQINAVLKVTRGKLFLTNFEEALKNAIEVVQEADILYENGARIKINAVRSRTENYVARLSEDPMAKQCLKDMKTGNFYQMDCYKMIIKSQAPDVFKGTVNYSGLTFEQTQQMYYVYEIMKYLYSAKDSFSPLKKTESGTIEFKAERFFYDNYINFQFTTEQGTFALNNVEGMAYYPYSLSLFEPLSEWERTRNWFTGYQNLPHCAIDGSKIWTFSGRSYDYNVTKSWHVAMVDDSREIGKNDLVILARRPNPTELEVYFSYMTAAGKPLEMEITPSNVSVKTNIMKTETESVTQYKGENMKTLMLEYYTNVDDGVKIFKINDGAIRFVYDGQRLIIFTDDHRRATTGICGQSTTQIGDDYKTPWGLVDQPSLYGASFSLEDEFSDPKTVELKEHAKQVAYPPTKMSTRILRSDVDWNKAENESIKGI